MDFKKILYSRFSRYVRINTQADENSKTYPSTKGQIVLGKMLAKEMKKIGMKNVRIDKYGYVFGEIPANINKKIPVIGFLAHMDTAPSASGKNIKPKLHKNYKGGSINVGKGVVLNTKNCPELLKCIGQDIVTASGDTLLGADNKAGIAIIMTAMEYLLKNPQIRHGELKVAFTPDEEIGKGVEHFNVKTFGADFAYTFDGDLTGTIEQETFNADSVNIKIKGKSVHPGTAKNAMANAVRISSDIINSWPEKFLPETTEKRQGFVMFNSCISEVEQAEIKGIVREHDLNKLKNFEKMLLKIIKEKRKKYPLAKIEIRFKKQYRNMKRIIDKHPRVMKNLICAVRMAGLKPVIKPLRGGTDGSRLSYMGLPCPNVWTGGFNYHGRYEWVSLDGMQKSVEVLINLVQNWVGN